MRKINDLRIHMLSLPDELPIDPIDLEIFASDGALEAAYGDSVNVYTLNYNINILVKNFSGDAMRMLFWVMVWIRTSFPTDAKHVLKFDADILNDESVDVSIVISMEELIKATEGAQGIELVECGVPVLDDAPLDAETWRLFANGPGLDCHPSDALADWACQRE